MALHSSLTPERWASFTLEQQILMIANELQRASKWMTAEDAGRRRNSYARALELTDLTVGGPVRRGFRRELLRWRDLTAGLFLADEGRPGANAEALRALLRLTYQTSAQIPHLITSAPAP